MASDPSPGQHEPGSAPEPRYAPLQRALHRAVSTDPWWRRLIPTSQRGAFPAMAALAAVLLLSLLGIVAPWNSDSAPAGGSRPDGDGPALLRPSPSPADPRSLTSQPRPGAAAEPTGDPDCDQPLSVLASPDIAGVIEELARPLATGTCPQVTVAAEEPSATLDRLGAGEPAPDVWIPASSLWLRQATAGAGADLPTKGTSIARTPIVVALPKPVHSQFNGFPVWMLIYNELTADDGVIAQASMPHHRTTVGALAQVSLQEALLANQDGDAGAAFLMLINFRNHVATTSADGEALLDQLATATAAQAERIGVFPATEQQLVAYHQRGPAMPVVPMGTYDANIHADYPMAVSGKLDDRLAGIADELRAQLRSPAARGRLVAAGFRPPMDQSPGIPEEVNGFPDGYTDPFPSDYPDPVALPDQARWQKMVDDWTWEG